MDSIDAGLLQEAAAVVKDLNKALDQFELTQLLSGPYDKEGAVISISAGAGGTDAQVILLSNSEQKVSTFKVVIMPEKILFCFLSSSCCVHFVNMSHFSGIL